MNNTRNYNTKDSDEIPTISALIQLMFVGLLGCNREIESEIQSFHERKKYPSNKVFFFYEFLSHRPIFTNENDADFKKIWFFAPFIQRLSRKSLLSLDPKEPKITNFIFPSDEQVATAEVIIEFNESIYMKPMYKWWDGKNTEDKAETGECTRLIRKSFLSENLGHLFMGDIEGYKAKSIETYIQEKNKTKGKKKKVSVYVDPTTKRGKSKVTWTSKVIEYGFIKPLIATLPKNHHIPSFLIPIASNKIFYGELLVWVPFIKKLNDRLTLANNLALTIRNHYVPALALLHEHFYEKNTKEFTLNDMINLKEIHISNEEKAPYNIPFCRISRLGECPENSEKCDLWCETNDEIENHLHDLWHKRMKKKIDVKESFIFRNYLVASPTMIDHLKDILKAARQLKKVGNSLPSVLIIGGPGSGKNKIAQFLRIFSNYYCKGKLYTVNMAAIKPDALVPPAMVGIDIRTNSKGGTIEIIGILEKIRKRMFEDNKNSMKKLSKMQDENKLYEEKKKYACFPTVVLDELNSMTIESQGVLLRFLENAEIVPIGGVEDRINKEGQLGKCKKKKDLKNLIDFLVIGVMNEDPDELSREKALEMVKKNPYVKGILGDLLYEYLLKIRRLRADLKYRMIRCGKFIVPDLKDRREDIPILFDYYVRLEIKELLGSKPISRITLNALESLMSPELEWPGNLRQLQALSKRVVEHSVLEYREDKILMIREKHIKKGMEDINLCE